MSWSVITGDCTEAMAGIEDSSVDSVVTDPPYGLEFMGKDWDGANGFRRSLNPADAGRDSVFGRASRTGPEYVSGSLYQDWCQQWAAECLRVLKPGGYLLAFGGTRTYHRLACAIEDAGFEIRDSLHWIYGSGFPKSLDVSKAIDKAAGATRDVVGLAGKSGSGRTVMDAGTRSGDLAGEYYDTAPATDGAKAWQGWGTALKPAHEPIIVARKPLSEKTVAGNVLAYGTGGINVDGCRVAASGRPHIISKSEDSTGILGNGLNGSSCAGTFNEGRWPPNILLTHSPDCVATGSKRVKGSTGKSGGTPDGKGVYGARFPRGNMRDVGYADPDGTESVEAWDCADDCPVAEIDRQSGSFAGVAGGMRQIKGKVTFRVGEPINDKQFERGVADYGGASRFYPRFHYAAKAPKRERPVVDGIKAHPTVKPVSVMQWLVRLVTPPGGTVLDPFAGTGTTAMACELEGFDCLLIERDDDYVRLINERMKVAA